MNIYLQGDQSKPGLEAEKVSIKRAVRQQEIGQVLDTAKSARDEAQQLGLKFEAYLLDLAVHALSDRVQSEII